MANIIQLLQDLQIGVVAKGITLLVLFLFIISVIIIFSSIQSFNRVIFIKQSAITLLVQGIAIIYFLATISLFILALAIL